MTPPRPAPKPKGSTASKKPAGDELADYRRRRDPSITPEPVPVGAGRRRRRSGGGGDSAAIFVIQEHHARALHWDFRLEREGVLVSWALPKGLPVDKKTNHLAVHTEDHPMEYASFAGKIPRGEYGGGEVIVWDHGTYEELKWSDREVMVVLHGQRAQGTYVLFATDKTGRGGGQGGRSWMIHKMDDDPAGYEPLPREIRPMLATLGELPKDDEAWAYEFKWDGIRAISYVDGGRIRIESRNGNDLTRSFPELRALGEQLGSRRVVLDGEIVAFDDAGHPRFQLLQPRIHASDAHKATALAAEQPVVYVVFDVLYIDGESLLGLSYEDRRRRLEDLGLLATKPEHWTLSPQFAGPGADVLRASRTQGLEGVLAKRLDSPYLPGKRSPSWTKVKNLLTQEVIVGGWTPGVGNRKGRLGSLLLGIPADRTVAGNTVVGEGLDYIGQVGTGFSVSTLDDLARRLEPRQAQRSPFVTPVPRRYENVAVWVKPTLVGEVSFSEWTNDGRLRHPSWRGLRDDKSPHEVRRES
ncbi:MAG TPA: non-homologous end-joining DNA ligase [Acidimicrobiales bacterium]|nr:non-homologous end-joining DNA ligase [Acidimicrobiales bacterium]